MPIGTRSVRWCLLRVAAQSQREVTGERRRYKGWGKTEKDSDREGGRGSVCVCSACACVYATKAITDELLSGVTPGTGNCLALLNR